MAQFNLAMMLFQHDNLASKDVMELLRDSAHAGYLPAMHQLGLFIVRDPAIAASPTEATDFLEEAAANGSWQSSALLGILARDGRAGVAQNKKVAYYHFRIATLQGGEGATTLLESDLHLLTSELAADSINSVDSDATAWMEKHKQACLLTSEWDCISLRAISRAEQ
jgi:TPR repeat protein